MYSDEQILERWWNIEDYAHDVWWACWAVYWPYCDHCGKTNTNEAYKIYLETKWVRKIKELSFKRYLSRLWWYEKTIEFLKRKKKTKYNRKKWSFKVKNISEVVEFARLTSIEKAAKEYWISTRTVIRYINLLPKD